MKQTLPIEDLAFQRLKTMVYSYTLFVKNLMEEGVELKTVKRASDKTWAMLGQQTAQQLKPSFGKNVSIDHLQQSSEMVNGVHGMKMTDEKIGNTIQSTFTKCAWQDVNNVLGIPDNWRLCQSGHAAFTKSMNKGLNPNAEYELTQKMPSGDQICAGRITL